VGEVGSRSFWMKVTLVCTRKDQVNEERLAGGMEAELATFGRERHRSKVHQYSHV